MDTNSYKIFNLEKHETKDTNDNHVNGELTVIWRDWDNLIKNHPKMVYVNSVNPGEIKETLTLYLLKSRYKLSLKLIRAALDAP